MKPHDYQLKAVQFAIAYEHTFMMIDAGMGKTLIALMFQHMLKRPCIVFAPLRVCYMVWPDEIKKWYPQMSFTVLHGPYKNKALKLKRDIYLINYDGLPWFFRQCCAGNFPLRKYGIVFDESTMIKEPSTNRFKILKKMIPMFSKYRMNLSATPAPIGLHNLWSQYYLLDSGRSLGPNYHRFRDKYFNFSGPPYYKTEIKNIESKKEIFKRIRRITYRLSSEDYLQMPDLIHTVYTLRLPPNLLKVYQELEANFAIIFEDGFSINAFSEITLRNKLRQFMQGAIYDADKNYKIMHTLKIDLLKQLLEELQGDPLLVPIQYRFEIEMIQKFIGPTPYIAGGVGAKQSVEILRKWNTGKIPLLLCHPKSLSHGMNLQAAGRRLLWLALPFSIEDYQQLYSRLWRQGQTRPVLNHHAVIEGTIDETLLPVLMNRQATQQDLFNAVKRRFQ